MTFFMTGQNEEWERSRGSLWLALALSIFLVYVIMAAQFESLLHPLVILFTIPLAFFGTVLTLYLLGISLSIVVFLGMIMLAGIVVNNAIVLVDYINVLRRRGVGDARGGGDRRHGSPAADPDDHRHHRRSACCRWRWGSATAPSCARRWRSR